MKQFLRHTPVHVRKYAVNEDCEYQPSKDGLSLSPKTWHSLCGELKLTLRHKLAEKVFVIEKDLCVSKQFKDGVTVCVSTFISTKKLQHAVCARICCSQRSRVPQHK